ncbi:alpha/beta fold hydrolase [Nocardia sp. NPDC101769]|uniref:alpha/beta fold hydrolase n=1 Tax=Nocardia sp. NPDC101769 TaxID=3364333 RepID=UPI00381EE2CB
MSDIVIDGLVLHYQRSGHGQPVVLVHGSWDDHHGWDDLVPYLEPHLTVIRYDRRGHGRSDCPPGQGRIGEDVDDLAGLIQHLGHSRVHLVGHSYGATVALLSALRYPQLCRSLTIHEPPLFALLAEAGEAELTRQVRDRMSRVMTLLASGEIEEGTQTFVDEVGFGPGTWDHVLDSGLRKTFIDHADTWLDQARDPDRLALEAELLATVSTPTLITRGDRGLPWYPPVMRILADTIPDAILHVIHGCAHAPQLTHPNEFATAIIEHVDVLTRLSMPGRQESRRHCRPCTDSQHPIEAKVKPSSPNPAS